MTPGASSDRMVLRELARQYAEIAARPEQDARRALWNDHLSLRPTRPPLLLSFGMHNVWCREVFADAALRCADPELRGFERQLRMMLFHAGYADDHVAEPWITVAARHAVGWGDLWGPKIQHTRPDVEGGAWHFDPVLREWGDVAKLTRPPHRIDEAETARVAGRLRDAIGDLLTVNVGRGPVCSGFMSDLVTHMTQLRGLEQMMLDMIESPDELHRLMAWQRDAVLANQAAAEAAGDLSLTSGQNQCMAYGGGLPAPRANVFGVPRSRLWAFAAAQEFTGVSPAMHEEFLLQYQQPVLEAWGLSAYGCCEDLTNKIDMLRRVRNLRIIAVTPRADVRRCAAQIGTDYAISWRPNPAEVICAGFDETKIRRILRAGLEACRGCRVHIHLKDVETLEGDLDRPRRWCALAREVIEEAWAP